MSDDSRIRAAAERLTQNLADRGLLLEAGWQTYRLLCLKMKPNEAGDALREAFMSGAEHLYSSIMAMLEPGDTETDLDVERMEKLDRELQPIRQALQLKYGPARGRG